MAGVLRRLLRDDRCGAVAVLTAMMGTVLFGFGALALDVGYWEVLRNRAQAAADQAALGAATEIVAGGTQASGQLKKQVKAIAASMGVVDGANGVAITENSPPSQGAYTASSDAVEVIINITAPRLLSATFLRSSPLVSVRAAALTSNGKAVCVLALDTSNTSSVTTTGNGNIGLTDCDLDANSPSSSALLVSGSGSVSATNINLVGNWSSSGAGSVSASGGALNTNAPATADPYSSRRISSVVPGYPNPTCNTTISTSGVVSLPNQSPTGVYVICGTSSQKTWNMPSTTIPAGVYVLDGLSIATGSNVNVTANGVTFIFMSKSYQSAVSSYFNIGAGSNVTWTAPGTGSTAGVAIWVDPSALSMSDNFTGGSSTKLTGAIYAPNDTLSFLGHAALQGCTQVIAKDISLTGSSQLLHNSCGGSGVIDVGGSPTGGKATLVE